MAAADGWPPPRFGGVQNPAYRLPRPPPDLRIHGVTSIRVSDHIDEGQERRELVRR